MESLPPMDPMPSPICASNAPSSAENGLPQLLALCPNFSKYSWNVRYTSLNCAPDAISLQTDSTTARYAPWNGLFSEINGL